MTGKRETKKRAVRKALYDAAIQLFEAQGYDGVSVDQIVAVAGVAKGTFFNHFPSKADILADWYRAVMQDGLDQTPDEPAALPDQWLALVRRILACAAASPRLWAAKTEQAAVTASIQQVERDMDAALLARLRKLAEAASAAGRFDRPVDAGELADLGLTLMTGTIREAQVTGLGATLDARLATRIRTLCRIAGYKGA